MKRVKLAGIMSSYLCSSALFAGAISYQTDRAIVAGNGCPRGQTQLVADEFGGLDVSMDAMLIDLIGGGEDQSLAARRSCVIRVPVTIAPGFYLRSVGQKITMSAYKSAGAEILASSRLTLSGTNLRPLNMKLPYGVIIDGLDMISTRTDELNESAEIAKVCGSGAATKSMLQLNLALSAQRDSSYEDILVAIFDHYVSEGIELDVAPCP